jgi:hypothetical protein
MSGLLSIQHLSKATRENLLLLRALDIRFTSRPLEKSEGFVRSVTASDVTKQLLVGIKLRLDSDNSCAQRAPKTKNGTGSNRTLMYFAGYVLHGTHRQNLKNNAL